MSSRPTSKHDVSWSATAVVWCSVCWSMEANPKIALVGKPVEVAGNADLQPLRPMPCAAVDRLRLRVGDGHFLQVKLGSHLET